jgi:2-polyprenyl-3-methyl-5-hydroxy-6-metoxy-1,4-benzoquinol methylase
MQAQQFWDQVYADLERGAYSKVEMADPSEPSLRGALAHFGDLHGKTLVDLGCGRGEKSLVFASRGANVISVDLSDIALRNLADHCREHGITNIRPVKLAAHDIAQLGPVDFIYGSMILHHIEPFDAFVAELGRLLRPGGKGFFWENNARSRLMIWFRQHVVGKLWVPKYGDPDEFPLTPAEVDMLRREFQVAQQYPELMFFRMASMYLLRGRLQASFAWLDRHFYRYPALRPYSYQQCVLLTQPGERTG